MTMIEAMEARVSTRSFDGKGLDALEAAQLAAMLESVATLTAPFGNRVRLVLAGGAVAAGAAGTGSAAMGGAASKPAKLGTYGLIAGASAFIVPAVLPGVGAMEDAGFILEKAVLEATVLGWSSCWIGGVFSRSKAAEIVAAADGELVPAVIALGRPAGKRSLADRIVTGTAKSRSRKPLENLVFSHDGSGLKEGSLSEPWLTVVQALRGAPSASNKQPWRLARLPEGGGWLIFLDEDRMYNNSLGEVHIQNIDIGIGMLHFQEAAAVLGMAGKWEPLPGVGDGLAEEKGVAQALGMGEGRGWKPIALWR